MKKTLMKYPTSVLIEKHGLLDGMEGSAFSMDLGDLETLMSPLLKVGIQH